MFSDFKNSSSQCANDFFKFIKKTATEIFLQVLIG